MNNYPLTEQVERIQTIVHSSQFMNSKQSTSEKWYRINSCIDFIRCTEASLEFYLSEISKQLPIDKGKAYLYYLGVFQALYIQQDVVMHLCESLDVEYPKDDIDLKEIRKIRNGLGHPTSDKYEGEIGIEFTTIGNPFPYADFIHFSLSHPNFKKYLPKTDDRNTQAVSTICTVYIPEKIEKQKSIFIGILDSVFETLNKALNNIK